jgi:5'(3')-deoxyribonucleotidase
MTSSPIVNELTAISMQRIALDMDGVLADVYHQFLDRDERDFGRRKTWDDIAGKSEQEAFPLAKEYVHTPGFFSTAPVVDGSPEVVKELNKKYELYIVSAATEFPQSLTEKQSWLREHFSFITWQQMVFCGSKQIIKADIMIDDHFKNLDNFGGPTTILYTQPHNALADSGKHMRVKNWDEIAKLLL